MSYFICPDCGKQHEIFGASHVAELAKAVETEHTFRLPIDPKITSLADSGKIEEARQPVLTELSKLL